MLVNKAIKIEVIANEETERSLDGQSRICNWLYNQLLNHAIVTKNELRKTGNPECVKTVYTKRGLRNCIPSLKETYPFLKSVYSSPLKNVGLRLSSAIQAHQKSKKGQRKGKSGWPKFRAWKRSWFSLFYDEPNKGFKLEKEMLILSLGVGQDGKRLACTLEVKDPSLLIGYEIRNLRIIKECEKFYAIFAVQVNLPQPKKIKKIIAIDPNHKNFGVGIDNEGICIEIAAPKWVKTFDKRIDELKSKRDRCSKKVKTLPVKDLQGVPTGKTYAVPSRNWTKRNKTLQSALYKRREQTKTFICTVAGLLCRSYDCIAIGDYTPHGNGKSKKMRRAMNNRSLIRRFKDAVSWTAKKLGKIYIEYDEKNTTRQCSSCDYCHEASLCPSIRKWQCPGCQTIHMRDENSAQNGLRKVLRDFPENYETIVSTVSGSDLVPVLERWAWSVLPSGVIPTLRGQNCMNMQL